MNKDQFKVLKRFFFSGRHWVADYFFENMSVRQGARNGVPKLTPKKCINNSIDVILHRFPHAKYVEGIAINGFPFIHAWNAFDTTWVDYTIQTPDQCTYAGIEIPLDLAIMCAEDRTWTMACGVMQTLMMSRNAELKKEAKSMLKVTS